ncbi:MAG: hypothetical protein ABJH07_07845 [Sedimentitalea sp.]|uniref:hypothetical protein n=1 Tax=Sedimentitalea sp. TaxID=2048915 RepID=UPI0032653BEC
MTDVLGSFHALTCDPDRLNDLLEAATFIGIAILAVPVWTTNLNKRRAAKHAQDKEDFYAKIPEDAPQIKILDDLHDLMTKDNDVWRKRDHVCLIVGYLLLLGSNFVRVIT